MSHKVKVLIIDNNRNSVITDMDQWLFERLNIKAENIKQHKSHSSLNKEVIEFFKIFGSD